VIEEPCAPLSTFGIGMQVWPSNAGKKKSVASEDNFAIQEE